MSAYDYVDPDYPETEPPTPFPDLEKVIQAHGISQRKKMDRTNRLLQALLFWCTVNALANVTVLAVVITRLVMRGN